MIRVVTRSASIAIGFVLGLTISLTTLKIAEKYVIRRHMRELEKEIEEDD